MQQIVFKRELFVPFDVVKTENVEPEDSGHLSRRKITYSVV